jgi:PhnB protein
LKGETTVAVKPIPQGYEGVTPYLIIDGAAQALDFYKKAFGAVELFRMPAPAGRIGHAEIKIGSGVVMLADEYGEMGYKNPKAYGGTPVSLMFYTEDVDAVFKRAIAAGAKELRPVTDQFYGDRAGTLADPFGHVWTVATHKEDLSPEELNKRMEAMQKS